MVEVVVAHAVAVVSNAMIKVNAHRALRALGGASFARLRLAAALARRVVMSFLCMILLYFIYIVFSYCGVNG